MPKKRTRKRMGHRLRPLAPKTQNSIWSYDFVYNACANSQKLKCLTVVDEYTNESFNGKFHDECLSMEWFRNRIEAKLVILDFNLTTGAVFSR